MQRRTFLRMAALSGLLAGSSAGLEAMAPVGKSPAEVQTVLLVTMCHLDVGFTQTQGQVLRKYFDVYFPEAIRIAAAMRKAGGDRYIWTTGSWLLYEYLEQASPAGRRMMEDAIAAGDICWHAMPFNWQTEMISRSMIDGAMGFSSTLDRRFGHRTTGGKMTDVPGHSRGLVAPLAAHGVRLLDIGVNPASTPPEVPTFFLWKDTAGNSLATMYHRHDYGSVEIIPGSSVAVAVEVRGDNSGPHTPAEIAAIYARLRAQFPGATVGASNFNEVASAIDRVRDGLPVVTAEIGDTWIYGCASDPVKVARYRELARLRDGWIAHNRFASGDPVDLGLLRRLLLAPEHTWGTDTKSYLDYNHYRPRDLTQVLDQPAYVVMQKSWAEKRADIDEAVASLPLPLRSEALSHLDALKATAPLHADMAPCDLSQPLSTRHFDLAFDPATGAIVHLKQRATGRKWASPAHPLALFTYQTLSAEEYTDFLKRYVVTQADWAPKDFGKPEMAQTGAGARKWHARIVQSLRSTETAGDRIYLQLAIEDAEALATGNVAWPASIFLDYSLPFDQPLIELQMTLLGKLANRLPEALWLTFAPSGIAAAEWSLEKVDGIVSPLDVIRGGGRAMHAVTRTVSCRDGEGRTLTLGTLDAPVVATGQRTPLNFTLQQPDMTGGVHFSLFNNAWGTNYPQWCGGDWMYRFQLHLS